VNFYISTFRRKIILGLSLIFLGIVCIDIALYFIADNKTTKNYFINTKSSKIKHFILNGSTEKDVVFMGSSRTAYQISTKVFKDRGVNVYNFGVVGAQFDDYPSLLPTIINSDPKKVVISLTINKLYEDLGISDYPGIEEISYYYNIDKTKFIKSLGRWLVNRHLFLEYSEPILYQIKGFYNKFNHHDYAKKHDSIYDKLNFSEFVGCEIFDIKRTRENRQILKCTNGDGVIVDSIPNKIRHPEKIDLASLNQDSILFFSKLIKELKEKTEVVVVFEPVFHREYQYNLDDLKKAIGDIKIVDMTGHDISMVNELWADSGHLNYKGRRKYSEILVNMLR